MKKLVIFLNRLFNRNSADLNQYFIVYSNPLSISQTTKIVNTMINKFSPGCRPNSISTSPVASTVRLQFESPCMQGEALKNIGEKTIEGTGSANPVKLVSLNGSQIWPSQEHTLVKDQAKTKIIDVLMGQVADLSMMSKIELGNDVIDEIKRLQAIINEPTR